MRHQLINHLVDLLINADIHTKLNEFDLSLSLKREFSRISEKSNLTDAEYFELNEIYESKYWVQRFQMIKWLKK